MYKLYDLIERYGEVCAQKTAGEILHLHPRTIGRMIRDGRLHEVERRVDVCTVYEYDKDPQHEICEPGEGRENRGRR